jgi:hypothetical protein
LDEFNKNRSNKIRLKLNVAKQKYSVTKNKLNKQSNNQQGNMMNTLRRKNLKSFIANLKE